MYYNILSFILSFLFSILIYLKFLSPFNAIDILFVILAFVGFILIFIVLYVLFIIIYSSTIKMNVEPKKNSKFLQYVTSWLSKRILFFTNTKWKVIGLEKIPRDSRFLLVSNHKTAYDAICYNAILCGYDVGFISKPENFNIPFVKNFIHGEFYLPIDRENDKEALKTILKAISLCKNNICSIGLFPEGTRNKTGQPLLEFKTGGFKIAQKSNIPIVVSVIRNIGKVSFNPFKHSKIEIEILEVIKSEDFPKNTIELGEQIKNIILTKGLKIENNEKNI